MAVGDERAHAVRLGERQRLLVVSYAAFSIELVAMGCQVTEKIQRMALKPGWSCEDTSEQSPKCRAFSSRPSSRQARLTAR